MDSSSVETLVSSVWTVLQAKAESRPGIVVWWRNDVWIMIRSELRHCPDNIQAEPSWVIKTWLLKVLPQDWIVVVSHSISLLLNISLVGYAQDEIWCINFSVELSFLSGTHGMTTASLLTRGKWTCDHSVSGLFQMTVRSVYMDCGHSGVTNASKRSWRVLTMNSLISLLPSSQNFISIAIELFLRSAKSSPHLILMSCSAISAFGSQITPNKSYWAIPCLFYGSIPSQSYSHLPLLIIESTWTRSALILGHGTRQFEASEKKTYHIWKKCLLLVWDEDEWMDMLPVMLTYGI